MSIEADFLEAREERQRELDRILAQSPEGQGRGPQRTPVRWGARPRSFFLISANIPGADKYRPGVARLLGGTLDHLRQRIAVELLLSRRDRLGQFHIAASALPPVEAKQTAIAIEHESPSARLVDVDVYAPDGTQLDRNSLGFAPRPCLVCEEPARECILLRRHTGEELLERVDSLLLPLVLQPRIIPAETLAASLRLGVLRELDLTPKPGLVDRADNGSHPDLSYERMQASAELLPLYFEEILACHRRQSPFEAYVRAGVEAEARMLRAVQSNAHKGFIFLSGIVLMAACRCDGDFGGLRRAIADVAGDFFARFGAQDSHGAELRRRHGLGGLRAEAEQGLPAVFEHGWPRYREALEAGWEPQHAEFYLMSLLMQHLQDTTAAHRCGLEALARLRADGTALQRVLEQQRDPEPMLAELNRDYRRSGLTMGGVADCMALTFALQASTTL